MDWFPWYPTDFRRDTYHLSLAEDGAYRRLIDEYMITRESLPGDDDALARIVGISRAEWDSISSRVRQFFRVRSGRLWHKRCEEELRAQQLRNIRNSERAKKAAFAKHSKINGITATRMLAPATLHKKEITTTSPRATARERPPDGSERVEAKCATEGERGETPVPHFDWRADVRSRWSKE